jgi:GNAT superfamily N-acetyltransferase
VIRAATPEDVPALLRFVHELATYERAPDAVEADEAMLHAALFGADAHVFALVAEDEGEAVGFALWFWTFSTWLGRRGVYLEDLYVRPEHRGNGHGRALLAALARRCTDAGGGRVEWAVLDWNTPAIDFYRSLGAEAMDEWTVHRLHGDALGALAAAGAP